MQLLNHALIWTAVSLNWGWIKEWMKIYIPQETMDVITYQRPSYFNVCYWKGTVANPSDCKGILSFREIRGR